MKTVWVVTETDLMGRSWANDTGSSVVFASLDKSKAEAHLKKLVEKASDLGFDGGGLVEENGTWWDDDEGSYFLKLEEVDLG